MNRTTFRVALPLFALVASAARAQVEFDVPRTFAARAGVDDMVVGDVDGDGNVDVVVGTTPATSGNSLGVFLGDATGGLQPRRDFALAFAPLELAGGDFDGDRRTDLAISDGSDGFVAILLADGLGGFRPPANVPLSGFPEALCTGDVNGDGKLDLVVSLNSATDARVLFGNGHGSFAPGPSSDIVAGASAIALADFDRDGFVDLVLTHRGLSDVLVARGDGLGHFTSPVSRATPLHPIALATPDLDGDGFPDLVVGTDESGMISVFLSDGLGGFGPRDDHANGAAAGGFATADFDGDGNADVATGLGIAGLALYLGDGAGGFAARVQFGGFTGRRIVAADVDRDGRLDLIAGGIGSTDVSLRLGDGAGGFRAPGGRVVGSAFGNLGFFEIGRVDDDAHVDAIAVDDNADAILAMLGDGTGAFGAPIASPIGTFTGEASLGDFDEDGHTDVALVQHPGCSSPPDVLGVFFGDGDGAFVPGPTTPIATCVRHVAVCDLDEDGHLDLVFGPLFETFGQITWMKGDGHGSFEAHVLVPSNVLNDSQILVADVDGDGHADVLCATETGGQRALTVLFGDGSGGIAATDHAVTPYLFTSLTAGDFDRDGDLDVAASALGVTGGAPILIFFNAGNRDLAEPVRYLFPRGNAGPDFFPVTFADLDEDGRLDLVSGNFVFQGNGSGGFVGTSEFDVGGMAGAIGIADADEDGHLDSVVLRHDDLGNLRVLALRNRTPFALDACRDGNVNAAAGPVARVLTVNGLRGYGASHSLDVSRTTAFQIRLLLPPAATSMRYVLYAWKDRPTFASSRTLPDGIGESCMVTPLSSPTPSERPKEIWNTLGDFPRYGTPTRTSPPAPGLIFNRPQGIRKHVTFFLQGIVTDPAAPNGSLAVTNGILVRSF
jgi:VCBS repeat protein